MVNCSCDFLSIKSDKEDDVLKLLGLLYFYLGPPGRCVGSFEVITNLVLKFSIMLTITK